MTRWQRFLWKLGFTGYAHINNASELLEQRQLTTVRATHARTRKERDRAFLLLRAARISGDLPLGLTRSINGLVALESEGDIEDATNEAIALLASIGWSKP